MDIGTAAGILIPFAGTSLGAVSVIFMKNSFSPVLLRALNGFAAGVMAAASVWSLLLPALSAGSSAVVCVLAGFWSGILFIAACAGAVGTLTEKRRLFITKHILPETAVMILAVVLHNLPEGLAVGAAFAGTGDRAGALALAFGIAVQNVPEGAIISLPLRTGGTGKGRAFLCGVLSGAVEPAAACVSLLLTAQVVKAMPFCLSFAAGAMIYVTVRDLIPETYTKDSAAGAVTFAAGFSVMMALDVLC